MNLRDKTVNFLGDSITFGYNATKTENIYHSILRQELMLKEARNYGVGGTRIARQKSGDYLEDFSMRAERMNQADMVIIFGGTNDFGHGNAKMGQFTDSTNYSFFGALHALIGYLLKHYKKEQIIFVTPITRKDANVLNESNNLKLSDYVNAIKCVTQYYKISTLDLYDASLRRDNFIQELLSEDGLHPNDKGHRFIADNIRNFLVSL